MQAPTASLAPTPLPNVIGTYAHGIVGPYRSRRCLALDEIQPDMIALYQVETDDSYDIADYHITPIIGRRHGPPTWVAAMAGSLKRTTR